MKQFRKPMMSCAAFIFASAAALAQSPDVSSASALASAPSVQRVNGIEYVSGGIGIESRAALKALQPDFPLRLVFSTQGGEYLVANTLTVRNAGGQLLALNSVGPILMLKLAPGDYTLNAIYAGRTEQKQVKVGTTPQTINWRW